MKYLITSALPYANGPLHFGHLAGAYLPADVTVRHKRLTGHNVKFISGTDEHGVGIMLNADKQNIDYKTYVDKWHKEHKELFEKYQIDFDFFGQTSEKYHEEEVVPWFDSLYKKGLIEPREDQQLYCNDCKNHLPDRFVEGVCYECGFESARGDECPYCGIWIEPAKLKNPICKICGSSNIEEVFVTQYYLILSKFHSEYRKWLESKKGSWRKTVYPYLDSLTKESLHDRAITRDLSWGIDVPLESAAGKKLYVWFDAPIGYVSNLKQHLKESGSSDDYLKDWWANKDVKIVNFIGKDNIIFHGVIFPVMSLATGMANAVTDLPANQYVNLEGKQFSKSSGWYIDAEKALDDFGSDALRYYLISLIPENSDSSFCWENMAVKVNNELANNIGNLVSRCLKFWEKNWPDGINSNILKGFVESEECEMLKIVIKEHAELLDDYQIRKGLEKVMTIGHHANNFFSDRAPWAQIKEDKDLAASTIGFSGINIFILGVLLTPYLPVLSEKILSLFGDVPAGVRQKVYKGELEVISEFFCADASFKLKGKPETLVPKIDDKIIASLNEELKGRSN